MLAHVENDGLRRRTLIALAALALLAGACGGGTTATGGADASDAAEDLSGDLTVFAASSLTDAFSDLAASFSEQYPDVEGAFNFAGSQTLAGQIAQGAPADVFASADQTQMDVVTDAGLAAGEPEVFISNVLEIAVEPGNPLGITGLEDLAKPDLVVVLAAPEVPAGQYAAEALANAGVDVTPASLEVDVRSVLSKVALGEADAGIVYRSDIVAGGDGVEGVEIPEDQNVPASYPIVTLADAPNPAAAAFVDYVLSEEGQTTLVEYGFTAP
jgi:molybdate transport system substrate-binding protein